MGRVSPQQPQVGAPVCPRHPKRESYVRCQRCSRPACPDCQRPAAVGVQCVDCVALSGKGIREPRTLLGARVTEGRPVLTYTILAICAAGFALQLLVPGFTDRYAYAPYFTAREPWRMLTSAFLHSPNGVFHLLFNMYALYLVGPYLESLLGRWRFGALYLVTAFAGSVGFLLLSPDGGYVVGASGAVFGLFGAYLVVQNKLGRDFSQVAVVLVINGVLGFVLPNIAWQAHLGGVVAGALLGTAFAWAPRKRRTPYSVVAVVALTVTLVLLAALQVQTFAAR